MLPFTAILVLLNTTCVAFITIINDTASFTETAFTSTVTSGTKTIITTTTTTFSTLLLFLVLLMPLLPLHRVTGQGSVEKGV